MGLMNKDYKGTQLERIIAPSIVRMSLGDLREQEPTATGNGEPIKGPKSKVIVNLTLEQPAKTVDGDELRPGTPFIAAINEWQDREDEAKAEMKELALAALGMDRKTKDEWIEQLNNCGGWSGLKGKHVMVEWGVKKGFNEVKHWNRVPTTPPATAPAA